MQLQSRAVAATWTWSTCCNRSTRASTRSGSARELVLAWESGAQPVVVLTKSDRVDADEIERQRADAQRFAPGVRIVCTSTMADHGLEELDDLRGPGHVIALLGASGAASRRWSTHSQATRSSCVAEVRDSDGPADGARPPRGQIVALADGSLLIDAPGIRGVGLWNADAGLERGLRRSGRVSSSSAASTTPPAPPNPGAVLSLRSKLGRIGADRARSGAPWRPIDDLEDGLQVRGREQRRQTNRVRQAQGGTPRPAASTTTPASTTIPRTTTTWVDVGGSTTCSPSAARRRPARPATSTSSPCRRPGCCRVGRWSRR